MKSLIEIHNDEIKNNFEKDEIQFIFLNVKEYYKKKIEAKSFSIKEEKLYFLDKLSNTTESSLEDSTKSSLISTFLSTSLGFGLGKLDTIRGLVLGIIGIMVLLILMIVAEKIISKFCKKDKCIIRRKRLYYKICIEVLNELEKEYN